MRSGNKDERRGTTRPESSGAAAARSHGGLRAQLPLAPGDPGHFYERRENQISPNPSDANMLPLLTAACAMSFNEY